MAESRYLSLVNAQLNAAKEHETTAAECVQAAKTIISNTLNTYAGPQGWFKFPIKLEHLDNYTRVGHGFYLDEATGYVHFGVVVKFTNQSAIAEDNPNMTFPVRIIKVDTNTYQFVFKNSDSVEVIVDNEASVKNFDEFLFAMLTTTIKKLFGYPGR